MDELIKAMSNDELLAIKNQHPDNASVTNLIDGVLATRAKEVEQEKVKANFVKDVEKLIAKLVFPDDVNNLYIHPATVDVEDTSQEPVATPITIEPAILDKDGKIVTPAITETQDRYPTTKVTKLVAEVNKGFSVTKATTSTNMGNGARTIVVKQEQGDKLVTVGEYPSSRGACDVLKQGKESTWVTDDSGTRELKKNGYIPFDKATMTLKG